MNTNTGASMMLVSSRQHAVAVNEVMVFRTSVDDAEDVEALRTALDREVAAGGRWNFDLEDRDRILRVESRRSGPATVIAVLRDRGFHCAELE